MFFSSDRSRNGNDRPTAQAEMRIKPLRYSLFQRFLDRRNASRDGRNGLPVYSEQPAAPPTIRRLVAEFTEQAAAERELWTKVVALPQQQLAGLTADARQAATDDAPNSELKAWRQKNNHEKLACGEAERKRLEQKIQSLHEQYLDRRNRLAAYTWRRIEAYWDRLIQVHPDGELLSEVINGWGSAQLGDPLRQLVALDEQMNRSDRFRNAIRPPEGD